MREAEERFVNDKESSAFKLLANVLCLMNIYRMNKGRAIVGLGQKKDWVVVVICFMSRTTSAFVLMQVELSVAHRNIPPKNRGTSSKDQIS